MHQRDDDLHYSGIRTPASPKAETLLDDVAALVGKHEPRRQRARRAADAAAWRETIAAITFELVHFTLARRPGGIAIPLGHDTLHHNSRYRLRGLGPKLPDLLRLMHDGRLIELMIGSWRGRRSTMQPRPKLRRLIRKHGVGFIDIGRLDIPEPLLLVSAKRREGKHLIGHLVEYDDDDRSTKLRVEIREVQAWIDGMDISLVARADGGMPKGIDVHDRGIYRVFNLGSTAFDAGGRWFGPFWQRMSSEDRLECLRLDGRRVVTLDFKNAFVNIIRARAGLPPFDGDAYAAVDGFEGFRSGARVLISSRIFDTGPRRSKPRGSSDELPALPVATLLDAIERTHHEIAHLFGCGLGFAAMHDEAEIAGRIMLGCMAANIPALLIHDCAVTRHDKAGQVEAIMRRASKAVVGQELLITRSEGGTPLLSAGRLADPAPDDGPAGPHPSPGGH